MFLMKRKDGRRGVAIVQDPLMLDDNWKIHDQIQLTTNTMEMEINGKKVKVYERPLIKFHISAEDSEFITEKQYVKGKKK